MNRRDALKKLGAGGAVALGVSAVRTVPAFAVAAPTFSFSTPTVQPAGGGSTSISVSITVEPTCGASSAECTGGDCTPPLDSLRVSSFDPSSTVGNYDIVSETPLMPTLNQLVVGLRRGTNPPGFTAPASGDSFQIEFTAEATCTAAGEPAAADQQIRTYSFDFIGTPLAWQVSEI